MATVLERVRSAWNVFRKEDSNRAETSWIGPASYGTSPHRQRLRISNERTIISGIYTRMSIDAASVDIRHVRLDDEARFLETMKSSLQDCFELEANIDQAATHFWQDVYLTMFDEGAIAIVPVETKGNPLFESYEIRDLRVGKIVNWYPRHVRVNLYNDRTGNREEVVLPKEIVAIVENPLYSVMNETNSTLQRLIRKLSLLDAIDEQMGSGRLDLIIQLPYVIKSEAREAQAEKRRKQIEDQLRDSQYGIAYTDGTEKITQLNRAAENNMLKQIEGLTAMLYSQLGLTESILDGTADEKTMLNYQNRTIKPLVTAVVEAMRRTFLTKTGRSQGQSILFFNKPFEFATLSQLAEIGDKFTRNEIISSNEMRGFLGLRPSSDPKADELVNSNMPQVALPAGSEAESLDEEVPEQDTSEQDAIVEQAFSSLESSIDEMFGGLLDE